MPKRKRSRLGRLRRYPSRRIRSFRRGKAPISLLTAIPIINSAVMQPILGDNAHGMRGAKAYIDEGNFMGAAAEAMDIISINFTGFTPTNGTFRTDKILSTYGAILMGYVGSKIADRMGANKLMKKIPFTGKYIKL